MAMMEFKKLLYIKSEQKVSPGMVRVLLEIHGIKAEVVEVKLVRKDGQIVVIKKGDK